ncbi:hypothetical protein bpmyx0001_5040 [Bacillus pseudomycoides DSM 12442]|nr:hypothetical protein bpmyx0001_5040 [Bacillus pseudomycoides DSM 12442]
MDLYKKEYTSKMLQGILIAYVCGLYCFFTLLYYCQIIKD